MGEYMKSLNNQGFTLLEVLVAIVIVSIGLLAVAGMQTTTISANASAKNGTIAIQLAEEMVDRIRVNAGDTPGIYNNIDTNNNCAGLTDPALGDCTQWRARLIDASLGLSGARGTITVTDDSPISKAATITVTITWGSITTRSITFTTIMETWLT
jgi:type IV pilus assembly protein PilV